MSRTGRFARAPVDISENAECRREMERNSRPSGHGGTPAIEAEVLRMRISVRISFIVDSRIQPTDP